MTDVCHFCDVDDNRIVAQTELTLTILDGFPVSPGHTLIIPKRHFVSFFEATPDERDQLLIALEDARADLKTVYQPDGFNIGVNEGLRLTRNLSTKAGLRGLHGLFDVDLAADEYGSDVGL